MKIGIYFSSESRDKAEELFYSLIEGTEPKSIRNNRTYGLSCEFKNGDCIRMIRISEQSRGYRSDIVYVPLNIDEEILHTIILPAVLHELKFY